MIKKLLLICLFVALTASNCDNPNANDNVTIPASDATAPKAALDAYLDSGIVSAGASPVTASVGNQAKIKLIASGTDEDGGVKDIQIWYETTITKCDGSGVCSKVGPGLAGAPATSNADSAKNPGDTASKSRLVTYTLDFGALRSSTVTSVSVNIWAIAVNFQGTQTQTQTLTLNWP